MSDTTKWVLQFFAAIICAAIIYHYIAYKIELFNESRLNKKKEAIALKNAILVSESLIAPNQDLSIESIIQELNKQFDQGFFIGLDISLLTTYPQITEHLNKKYILVTDEIAKFARKESHVVSIQQFKGLTSQQDESTGLVSINESYIQRIGLDRNNISDRAIGSYLYTEKTNLMNVKFVTMEQSSFQKANLVGLRAVLL